MHFRIPEFPFQLLLQSSPLYAHFMDTFPFLGLGLPVVVCSDIHTSIGTPIVISCYSLVAPCVLLLLYLL